MFRRRTRFSAQMSSFVVLIMALAFAKSSSALSSAEDHTCPGTKDQRSLLANLLKMTGYSDTCVAVALDECGAGHAENRYAPLIEEAREVVQQLSAVVGKLDTHLSAPVSESDSDPSAAVIELASQPSAARNECESRVAVNKWESNISAAGNTSESLPRHCKDIQTSGDSESGQRLVYPYPDFPAQGVTVYCDQTTDGGGWTVFQRRSSEAVRQDFFRNWTDYEFGFGDLEGEFWAGLQLLHQLTSTTLQQLRIDLDDYEGEHRWAKYGYFHVGARNDDYRLGVGSYSGDAGDSLAYHSGKPFSTHDADNDSGSTNCAEEYQGAWWYGSGCHNSNLNGYQYAGSGTPHGKGINWHHWRSVKYSLKATSMMTRPAF